MLPSDLHTALSALQGFQPGVGAVDDLVYLAARFCDTLAGSVAATELHRRAGKFETLTGLGSTFEGARADLSQLAGPEDPPEADPVLEPSVWTAIVPPAMSLDSLRERFGERFFDPKVGHCTADETVRRPLLPAAAKNRSVLMRWWCRGEQTIHDAPWVRCNLYTAFAITQHTVESEWEFSPAEFNPALVRFRDQLWAAWRRSDQEHLLGSYLLEWSQKAVDAGPAECRKLAGILCEPDVQTRAVVAAAEDLCRLSTDRLPPPNAASPKDADDEPAKKAKEVTISLGKDCFVLRCDGFDQLCLTPAESQLFTVFVHRAARGVATEVIRWSDINAIIGKDGPEAAARQEPAIAKGLGSLNQRLSNWASTPNGKPWIGTVKGERGGRRLNAAVKWLVDDLQPLICELMRKSPSVSASNVSGQTAARHTPNRGTKLPGRARRDKAKYDDEDDEDE